MDTMVRSILWHSFTYFGNCVVDIVLLMKIRYSYLYLMAEYLMRLYLKLISWATFFPLIVAYVSSWNQFGTTGFQKKSKFRQIAYKLIDFGKRSKCHMRLPVLIVPGNRSCLLLFWGMRPCKRRKSQLFPIERRRMGSFAYEYLDAT